MSFRRLLRPSGRGKALRRINSCQPHLQRERPFLSADRDVIALSMSFLQSCTRAWQTAPYPEAFLKIR